MRLDAKTDANHAEIRAAFRAAGAVVIDTFQLKNAFDMLVAYRGTLYAVEVKNGSLPPSKRRLSEGEKACKAALESVGVPYHVVKSVEEAIELLDSSERGLEV